MLVTLNKEIKRTILQAYEIHVPDTMFLAILGNDNGDIRTVVTTSPGTLAIAGWELKQAIAFAKIGMNVSIDSFDGGFPAPYAEIDLVEALGVVADPCAGCALS